LQRWREKKESNMALANLKDKDEQTPQKGASAAGAGYPNKSEELRSSERILVRKGKHLDVDGVLAHSFKDVKLISPALNQQSFEQGKAT
jgi:hypothetical protein